ncbi:MAG: Septum formation initiator [Marmoricola sp.]|nr:Septum formation initiator [Marmoricola sp.]
MPSATEAAPRARFTNRAAILVVVFAILVISYASSMRAYLTQRSHINALNAQIAQAETNIKALQREKNRWRDPAYVEQQARSRLGWVLPGETAYQVLDQNGNPLTGGNELTDPTTIDPKKPEAWWNKVQQSLDAADHPEKLVKPTPATVITPPSTKQ